FFLKGSLMDRTQLRRHAVSVLEVLDIGRTAVNRTLVRDQAQLVWLEAGRGRERSRGYQPLHAAHEVRPDRQRDASSGAALPDCLRLIEAGPHADDDRRVETDEPRVAVVVCRAGLAADGPAQSIRPR